MKGKYTIRRFTKASRVKYTEWGRPYGRKYMLIYVCKGGKAAGNPLAVFKKSQKRKYVNICKRLNKGY